MIIEGETILLEATFKKNGTLTSPTTPVKVSVKDPAGTEVVDDAIMTEVSAGLFTYSFTTTDAGVYEWEAVSADGAIEQRKFKAYERTIPA